MTRTLKDFEHISYSQGKEIKSALGDAIKQRSDVSGGICFSLCCQWMELHKKYHGMGGGEKYRIDCMTSRLKDLMSDSVFFYRAMNSQAGDYRQDYDSKLEQKNATGKKYGLIFGSETQCKNYEQIQASVSQTHAYTQTSFAIGKLGRHAICAYKSGGKLFGIGSHLYVFDPNFGEYRVPSGNIIDFYRALFSAYGKNISGIVTYQIAFNP